MLQGWTNTTTSGQGEKHMSISFETAALVQDVANWVLIGTLFVGVVATYLIVWMGNIKEEYFSQSIASANAEAARAKEGAARALQGASEANVAAEKLRVEAEQARLETEKIKATVQWREIPQDKIDKLTSLLAKNPSGCQIQYVANDPEAFALALRYTTAFKKAGWKAAMFSVTHPTILMVGFFISDAEKTETTHVKAALKGAGIPFAEDRVPAGGFIMGDPADAHKGAVIVVGSKPRPELGLK